MQKERELKDWSSHTHDDLENNLHKYVCGPRFHIQYYTISEQFWYDSK